MNLTTSTDPRHPGHPGGPRPGPPGPPQATPAFAAATVALALAAAALSAAGCTGSGARPGAPASAAAPGATPAPTGASGAGGSTPAPAAAPAAAPAPAAPDFDALAAAMRARAAAYLQQAVAAPPQGEGLYTQLARLELSAGPLDRTALEGSLLHLEQRRDTADFHANGLLRLLLRYSASPLLPSDLRGRAEAALLGFRYALEDPSRGEELCMWSENHIVLFATAEYLAGHLFSARTFQNAGLTGAQHARRGRARVLRWLDLRARFGFSEWYSPVYTTYDVLPLLNLVDFAPDADVRERAAQVLDLLLFDLARLTHRGSFAPSSGRAYEEHKLTGWGQSVGDLVEVLFGTRGRFTGRNSPGAIWLATSRGYRVPHVLLGVGTDAQACFEDRSRSGISFADAPAEGLGFTSFDDGLFWWGMGAYAAKDTIVLSRRMIRAYRLESYPAFREVFGPLQAVPDALLPVLADALSPVAEGSVLSTANVVTWRTPDAMLSSVQSYRRGQVGFQQHAWQATLDADAVVFTTAPGNRGHDGPTAWTGSASLPRVVQVDDVALVLYDPPLAARVLFPDAVTHAFFPRAAFDEVATRGAWTFGRKGDGYVALYSGLPATWQAFGAFADRELVARGSRNAWICQVGRRAEDGAFADFCARVAGARVAVVGAGDGPHGAPFSVLYDAPGVGTLELDWSGPPRRNGQPLAEGGFARHDSPYARTPWGARAIRIAHGGASLELDLDRGTRAGRGL